VRLKALLVVAAIVAGSAVSAQKALPPTRDQFFTTLGAYFDTLRIQAGIPGVAAAIVGDTTLEWAAAFGQRDIASVDAMKTDTPFEFDGLTQLVTTSMVLQCVEQGTVRLDSPIGAFTPSSPDARATVGEVLTQTTNAGGTLAFTYNLQRLETLKFVVETCQGMTFRQAFTKTLQRLGMMDSVPGPDAPLPELSNADVASPADAARYRSILQRMPTPYAVSAQNTASVTSYTTKTIGAGFGLVSTVYDFAKFDLALRNGQLGVSRGTLAAAWTAPVSTTGLALPHGMGWFVQSYNGEPVVWQYGISPAVSSSLVITLPNRNVTLILLANSDGLARPPSLVAGDVTVSPFAKIFLGLVVK
jgi:CubicO group peptidase (beta-lactamase class C family)